MSDIAALIERLETATVGSRGFDYEIHCAIGWRDCDQGGWIRGTDCTGQGWPDYTTSLDAALTLVPDGKRWQAGWSPRVLKNECGFAIIEYRDGKTAEQAATPALALCIAALKARLQ